MEEHKKYQPIQLEKKDWTMIGVVGGILLAVGTTLGVLDYKGIIKRDPIYSAQEKKEPAESIENKVESTLIQPQRPALRGIWGGFPFEEDYTQKIFKVDGGEEIFRK